MRRLGSELEIRRPERHLWQRGRWRRPPWEPRVKLPLRLPLLIGVSVVCASESRVLGRRREIEAQISEVEWSRLEERIYSGDFGLGRAAWAAARFYRLATCDWFGATAHTAGLVNFSLWAPLETSVYAESFHTRFYLRLKRRRVLTFLNERGFRFGAESTQWRTYSQESFSLRRADQILSVRRQLSHITRWTVQMNTWEWKRL